MQQFVEKTSPLFELKKIKSGNVYAVFFGKNTAKQVKYFVYEIDPISYLVCDFSDSLVKVKVEKRAIKTIEKVIHGTIETSLWNCMKNNNLNPMLAVELSEIYACTIDFFALQKGDNFNIVYNESFVDSMSIGITAIKGVLFNYNGQRLFAIPFLQKGKIAFFDSTGRSMQRSFLRAPLKYTGISSKFSSRRLHPILRIVRPHWGVDYKAPVGTPVHTIGDGVVVQKVYSGGAGNLIRIKHDKTFESAYMHLNGFAESLRIGKHVKQGELIGFVGSTGLATGPHLDFRIYKNGKPIDPLKFQSPPSEPVDKADLPHYSLLRDSVIHLLSTKVK